MPHTYCNMEVEAVSRSTEQCFDPGAALTTEQRQSHTVWADPPHQEFLAKISDDESTVTYSDAILTSVGLLRANGLCPQANDGWNGNLKFKCSSQ